jgi:hypothetical protein
VIVPYFFSAAIRFSRNRLSSYITFYIKKPRGTEKTKDANGFYLIIKYGNLNNFKNSEKLSDDEFYPKKKVQPFSMTRNWNQKKLERVNGCYVIYFFKK